MFAPSRVVMVRSPIRSPLAAPCSPPTEKLLDLLERSSPKVPSLRGYRGAHEQQEVATTAGPDSEVLSSEDGFEDLDLGLEDGLLPKPAEPLEPETGSFPTGSDEVRRPWAGPGRPRSLSDWTGFQLLDAEAPEAPDWPPAPGLASLVFGRSIPVLGTRGIPQQDVRRAVLGDQDTYLSYMQENLGEDVQVGYLPRGATGRPEFVVRASSLEEVEAAVDIIKELLQDVSEELEELGELQAQPSMERHAEPTAQEAPSASGEGRAAAEGAPVRSRYVPAFPECLGIPELPEGVVCSRTFLERCGNAAAEVRPRAASDGALLVD